MSKFFIFTYLFVLWIIYIIALPVLFFISLFSKYKNAIPARFFLHKNEKFEEGGVWFHACSLGEVSSLLPLINTIKDEKINISVITQTGFDKAKTLSENVRFLPFEIFLPFWITKQKILVVTEAELWLMLFFVAKQKGAKTILVNARISDNSHHRYKKFKWFYKRLFSNIDEVYAQSKIDKERLEDLGAKNVEVTGNIKSAFVAKATKNYAPNLSIYDKVITLASTHIGEEAMLLDELDKVSLHNTLVIVVPRHPERFDAVHKLIQSWSNKKGKTYSRFSRDGFDTPCDVMLCDVVGELVNIYAITDITILGGSFIEGVGGHNPLEPASFHNSIISGPYFYNQKELYAKVDGIVICDIDHVAKIIKEGLPKTSIKSLDNNNVIIKSILKTK
ncbi:MAG: lipid IV(A) 3-deoxy-D-manno-octulosonic acid transferase [Campylobacteraceae bacterium]